MYTVISSILSPTYAKKNLFKHDKGWFKITTKKHGQLNLSRDFKKFSKFSKSAKNWKTEEFLRQKIPFFLLPF